jgi:hypothetical protein
LKPIGILECPTILVEETEEEKGGRQSLEWVVVSDAESDPELV